MPLPNCQLTHYAPGAPHSPQANSSGSPLVFMAGLLLGLLALVLPFALCAFLIKRASKADGETADGLLGSVIRGAYGGDGGGRRGGGSCGSGGGTLVVSHTKGRGRSVLRSAGASRLPADEPVADEWSDDGDGDQSAVASFALNGGKSNATRS